MVAIERNREASFLRSKVPKQPFDERRIQERMIRVPSIETIPKLSMSLEGCRRQDLPVAHPVCPRSGALEGI